MIVVVLVLELAHAAEELVTRDQALLDEEPLQGGKPALVIAPVAALHVVASVASLPVGHLRDQALAELLPLVGAGLGRGDRETESTALPRLSKTSSPFRRGSAATPSMWATSGCIRTGPRPGDADHRVAGDQRGQLVLGQVIRPRGALGQDEIAHLALESQTRTSTDSSSSRPSSARTARGSTTMRAR